MLPLGTGNDLARVLGWGAVLDDDNQLPKLLESFERATTKMLDRWSIMTYESHSNAQTTHHFTQSINSSNTTTSVTNTSTSTSNNIHTTVTGGAIPQNESDSILLQKLSKEESNLAKLEDSLWYHLNNMLQNENITSVIESSIKFNDTLNELLISVYGMYSENAATTNSSFVDEELRTKSSAMTTVVAEQCISLKYFLDEFFSLLKSELRPKVSRIRKVFKDSETSAAFTEESPSSSDSDENDYDDDNFLLNDNEVNDNGTTPSDELKKLNNSMNNGGPQLGASLNYNNVCKSNLSLTNKSYVSMGASVIF